MSLRALGSLLTRRFAARGIPRAQARVFCGNRHQGPRVGGREASALSSLPAATALAGFVTIVYFNKDTDESAREATKEVGQVVKEGDLDEEAIKAKFVDKNGKFLDEETIKAKFVDKDGNVKWLEYLDYLNTQMYYDKEVPAKQATDKEIGREAAELEDLKIDEEMMYARFDDWMKQYGRSYKSEEEKARRYEIFKMSALDCDRRNKRNASKPNGARFGIDEYADRTEEEWIRQMGGRTGVFPWEEYFAEIKALIAEGRVKDAEYFRAKLRERAKDTKDVSDKVTRN